MNNIQQSIQQREMNNDLQAKIKNKYNKKKRIKKYSKKQKQHPINQISNIKILSKCNNNMVEQIQYLYPEINTFKLQKSIQSIISHLPQLNIQQLFSNSKHVFSEFQQEQVITQAYQYLQTINKYSIDQQTIIINKNNINHLLCKKANLLSIFQTTKEQIQIIKMRQQQLLQIEKQSLQFNQLSKNQYKLNQIQKEIVMIYRLYRRKKQNIISYLKQISNHLNQINFKKQKQSSFQIKINENENDIIVRKALISNYKNSFIKQQIDYFNYFLEIQRKIFVKTSKYNKIKNQQQFKGFLQKRKAKPQKADKFILQSACTVCLSHKIDNFNRFAKCKQCYFRFHELCNKEQKTCDRCNYKRLTKQMKQLVSQCYICNQTGLMIKKIERNKYVHVFCLVSHNLWSIKDGQIVYSDQKLKILAEQVRCSYCNRISNLFYLFRCKNCHKSIHAMCGFLSGCEMLPQFYGYQLKLKIDCCNTDRKLNEKHRKFKVNYQKCVFRENGIGEKKE